MRRMTGPVRRCDPRADDLAREIIDVLRERPGLTAEDVAARTGYTYNHMRGVLLRMHARGMVDRQEAGRRINHGRAPFRYSAGGERLADAPTAFRATGD